jgi:hypothetical protein
MSIFYPFDSKDSSMSISEERLQLLLSRELKRAAQQRSRRLGLSVGEYVRQLLERDINAHREAPPHDPFPFGETAIRTGRTHGSVGHDRPAESIQSE